MNETEKKLFRVVAEHGHGIHTRKEYVALSSLSTHTVKRAMLELRDNGLVEKAHHSKYSWGLTFAGMRQAAKMGILNIDTLCLTVLNTSMTGNDIAGIVETVMDELPKDGTDAGMYIMDALDWLATVGLTMNFKPTQEGRALLLNIAQDKINRERARRMR